MHIRSFVMGSTAEAPLAKPELHGLKAWLLSQTFLILLMGIPAHAFLQDSISMTGLCFSIFTVPSMFFDWEHDYSFPRAWNAPPVRQGGVGDVSVGLKQSRRCEP